MVPYGIAKDGLRTVLNAINPKGFGPRVAFQVNLRTSDDPKPQADVVHGEAREVTDS